MFFVSTFYSPTPNKRLGEKITDSQKNYKKKYPRHYSDYDNVLKDLFENSLLKSKNSDNFLIYQQIAIQNKVDLKHLLAIEFISLPEKSLIKLIEKKFPHVSCLYNFLWK